MADKVKHPEPKYVLKAVGADPEFFLTDGYGSPMTAIGQIGGTKIKPRFINDDGFSAVQEDNVMVEFNILPAKSARAFSKNIQMVMDHLYKELEDKKALVKIVSHMEFADYQLDQPQAKEIGCDGDFNAWTCRPNPILNADILGKIRTAGGHVHVSYDVRGKKPDDDSKLRLVRCLDLSLGLASVWLDRDDVRRKYYGKAGAFRSKPYGVEYRTLSNFWIKNPQYMEWVFNQVQWTFNQLNNGKEISPQDQERIQKAINTPDRGLAQELMLTHGVEIGKELEQFWKS